MVKMGTVWDRTVEFISDNLGVLMPVALLAIFVPASAMQSLTPLVGQGGSLGLSLVLLLLSLLAILGRLAVVALALDIANDARAAIGIALSRLPAFILVTVVLGIVGLILLIPVGLIFGANGVDLAALQSFPPAIPEAARTELMLYGLVLFAILLWAGARLLPLVAVIVGERRWIGAIGRAFRLTKGAALKIIGVVLLYVLVSSVAGMAAKTVFGSILRLLAGNDDVVNVGTVLTSIIVAAVGTAFQVLASAFTAKLYLALWAEKEGEVVAG